MNTSTTQLLVRPSNPPIQFLQGAAKTLRRLGRAWKRSLPTIEFGGSAAAAARGYRRAALLAARRGDRQAACRLEAAVRAVGGGQ